MTDTTSEGQEQGRWDRLRAEPPYVTDSATGVHLTPSGVHTLASDVIATLRTDLAAAMARAEDAERRENAWTYTIREMHAEKSALEAQVRALEPYARHMGWCLHHRGDNECNCGYDALQQPTEGAS